MNDSSNATEKNGLDELREILFDTLRGVKLGTVSIERGKAVGELTQVIVNTAKIEIEFHKATKGRMKASAFFPADAELSALPPGTLPGSFHHRLSDEEPAGGA